MKLWVVFFDDGYDKGTPLGVFSTQVKAANFRDQHIRDLWQNGVYVELERNYYRIEEYTLDSSTR